VNESELRQLIIGVMNASVPGIDASVLEGDDEIGPTLDIDSFDQLQIQAGLNEKLGVEIPEKEYARLKTLNQLVAYFRAK
jgi:acyl carrier protein